MIRDKKASKSYLLKGSLIFIIIFILWSIASYYKVWNSYLMPSPKKVFDTFLSMTLDGSLLLHIYASVSRVIIGFSISILIGVPLGIVFGLHSRIYEYFRPLLNFLKSTPPLALIPMLILWFGIGEKSKIIIIVLASFFPIFASTLKGIKSCDIKLIEVGKIFRLSKLEVIFRIIIPNAVLDIAVGFKLALGYSFRAIIGAELVAASSGLGYLISDGKEMSRTDVVIVGIIVIGILGIIADGVLSKLVNKVSKGKTVENYD